MAGCTGGGRAQQWQAHRQAADPEVVDGRQMCAGLSHRRQQRQRRRRQSCPPQRPPTMTHVPSEVSPKKSQHSRHVSLSAAQVLQPPRVVTSPSMPSGASTHLLSLQSPLEVRVKNSAHSRQVELVASQAEQPPRPATSPYTPSGLSTQAAAAAWAAREGAGARGRQVGGGGGQRAAAATGAQ